MHLPFPGIGIIFDIDELGGGFYGHQAWKIFMKHLNPFRLVAFSLHPSQSTACIILEGETNATLNGKANEFCIAIYAPKMVVSHIKTTFMDLKEKGLASKSRRFIEKPQLDKENLSIWGQIDALSRFVTDSRTRIDRNLRKEMRWSYKPETNSEHMPKEPRKELSKI